MVIYNLRVPGETPAAGACVNFRLGAGYKCDEITTIEVYKAWRRDDVNVATYRIQLVFFRELRPNSGD